MNLIKKFKVNRQLKKWRRSIRQYDKVLILDGTTMFKATVLGWSGRKLMITDPTRLKPIAINLECVFPVDLYPY